MVTSAKVKSVRYIGQEDVYNMEVENHHNFSVDGGLIVHNCFDSFRYNLISYHMAKSKGLPESKSPIKELKDKMARQNVHRRRKLT